MRLIDKIKISQTNSLRSKLRTILTVGAIFIGTFTISLTNGVGNGIKAYVDSQLGNLGAENTFLVQKATPAENPLQSDVQEYDPERIAGAFNQSLLTADDIKNMGYLKGVEKVTPQYMLQVAYVTAGDKKYMATVEQFLEGLRVDMAAGELVVGDTGNGVNIPTRFVEALGLGTAENAVGKTITIGYKNSADEMVEKDLVVKGVMQPSLLGGTSFYIIPAMAAEIYNDHTRGVAALEGRYGSVTVTHPTDWSEEQAEELRQLLNANGYMAMTLADAVGIINTIINGILIVLNIFSVIALVAATFGIINTLFMAVTERTSEIGLMKALGANRGSIFSIFAIEAASIGFWGGVLGVGVTMGLAPIVNSIASNTVLEDFVGFDLLAFPIGSSLLTVGGIILLAFIAGTLPSIKASKLDPIKALRYE